MFVKIVIIPKQIHSVFAILCLMVIHFSACTSKSVTNDKDFQSKKAKVECVDTISDQTASSGFKRKSVSFGKVTLDFVSKFDSINAIRTIELFNAQKKIHTHVLFREEGDCSSVFLEIGSYEIKENTLIFYTYWCGADRMSNTLVPFGAKIKEFKISKKGELLSIKAEVYKEDFVNDKKNKGVEYLNSKPKNQNEIELLKNYITLIETQEEAHFVAGNQKFILLNKVKDKLRDSINSNTKNWKEVFGNNIKV